jgi:hypothetical protein
MRKGEGLEIMGRSQADDQSKNMWGGRMTDKSRRLTLC